MTTEDDLAAAPSFWLETCGDALTPRPSLPGDTAVDVAVVGAGYTGLWAAHHLLAADPTLRVAILEREVAGWGASGRNGGWCSALFAASWPRLARQYGVAPTRALRQAMRDVVGEVEHWCRTNGVDAHARRGGTLTLARSAAQAHAAHASLQAERDALGDTDTRWLDTEQVGARITATGVQGATYNPYCAALHPARLARGLARVVEGQGAAIYERTPVTEIEPGRVTTLNGVVRAEVVIRATEGYTADLAGHHRDLAPIWSLVIATDPLPAAVWDELGWSGRETLSDGRHLLVYGQRTADDRIVFGGRGAPYRYGSATDGRSGHDQTFTALEHALHDLLPATRGHGIHRRWGGVLGVSRDWMPAVVHDRSSGLAWAGGYVGDGVGCAALAGHTLADLVLGHDTDRTRLPWVGHRWRRWEPEPLRWAGIATMNALMGSADRVEERTGRSARRAALLGRLVGE